MDNQKISERDERIKKLEELKKKGINPYPSAVKRTHKINDVLEGFNKLETSQADITLAGRLRTIRAHGNLTFAHLEDESGRLQVALSKAELGDSYYKDFVKLIDMGDFIEATGKAFTTHKGEKSVRVSAWKVLAKAIKPLPDKWHGLSDDDKRQRFRELEMISDREVLEKFKRRSQAIKTIREFMWKNEFTEIETPILQNVYGGTYAKPFMTHYNALDFDLYLRIAPEIFLKRSVVGGLERIFEIGKCFRNEGVGPAHLQEFTMFEFYWPYADYGALMDFTEKLISEVIEKVYKKYEVTYGGEKISFKPPFKRVKFRDLIKEYLKVDFSELDTAEKVEKYVKKHKLEKEVNLKDKLSWPAKIDELYKKTVRKKIIKPIFVTDYPKEFMALAKTKDNDPGTVSTFQLVVNGWELIKAYNELNDPIDQRERFEAQERLKMEGDEEAMPYDRDFVESMEYGMPPMAGWGMGLDRFFALLEEEDNLRDTIIFPTMKPLTQIASKADKTTESSGANPAEADSIDDNGELGIDYKKAKELVGQYISDPVTKLHSRESEVIMRALAKKFKADEEKWGIIGLLHDLDWDLTKNKPETHTMKTVEILKENKASDFLIETILSHNYGYQLNPLLKDKKRTSRIQHALASAETVTGLIVATALMQPDKKLSSVKLESLKKKFKTKGFAAKVNRDIIMECGKIGLELEEFLSIGLEALQDIGDELGL